MAVELNGYKYSVYAWIARFALHEKGVAYNWVEVNPFAQDVPARYLELHPFCRVPTLVDGAFVLYETGAITRYIDEAFAGPRLQPPSAEARARVNQIISIVDSYAYIPLVRQVFAHAVMGPRLGRSSDPSLIERGLKAAPRILDALDRLAEGTPFLVGRELTLADIHLAPMIGYFAEAEQGRSLLDKYALRHWWQAISRRAAFLDTRPPLPAPARP